MGASTGHGSGVDPLVLAPGVHHTQQLTSPRCWSRCLMQSACSVASMLGGWELHNPDRRCRKMGLVTGVAGRNPLDRKKDTGLSQGLQGCCA
eukprot:1162014-Pelagomonas_calceolata.AAC.16